MADPSTTGSNLSPAFYLIAVPCSHWRVAQHCRRLQGFPCMTLRRRKPSVGAPPENAKRAGGRQTNRFPPAALTATLIRDSG